MDKYDLINVLPPYQDRWITVKEKHEVDDIIEDILDKHQKFSVYYDKIALYFDKGSIEEICELLNDFCINNIEYREEKEKDQTTALPTGILIRGYGDCKHYAGFIGGILDGLNRVADKNIEWCYRFASYNLIDNTPGHVFIVVYDRDKEIKIDPTPGADKVQPYWIEDIYITNSKTMPLKSNIGSLALAELATDPAAQEAGQSIFSGISNLFKDFFNSLTIGDQVPNYPIKSKNTYTKIVTQIQGEFPPPTNIDMAREQFARAKELAQIMNDKGGDVNITYSMIYTEVANALQQIIAQAETQQATGTGVNPFPNATPTVAGSTNWLVIIGLGLAAFYMMKPKRKVSGMNETLTLAAIGIGAFLVFKPKPNPVTTLDQAYSQ